MTVKPGDKRPVFKQGQLVFVPDDEEGYVPGKVIEAFTQGEKGGVVELVKNGGGKKTLSKDESSQVERMDPQSYEHVNDMTTLRMLNNGSLMYNLRQRYLHPSGMIIYTEIGSILVSLNPYQDLGLYTSEQEQKYLNAGGDARALNSLPPHVFKVAEMAFQAMTTEAKNQSCVITGESGAGKSETTKRFLQYVSEKSSRNASLAKGGKAMDTQKLRSQILDSSPFMEAFGNAKTLRNDNSSRFGKLINMYFDTNSGVVVSAGITSYLLEKSRVVKVSKGERNYHCFYQLCEAASTSHSELKKKYHLQSADMFRYCLGDNKKYKDIQIDEMNDGMVFDETVQAMKKLGMDDDEIELTWRICSGILHFGNIVFDGDSDSSQVSEDARNSSLHFAAELLGIDAATLETACVQREIMKGVVKQHSQAEAESTRDAVSKHLYGKLFDWLVSKINDAMTNGNKNEQHKHNVKCLGVLDIFGFETFEVNSFEQLCINFCNEKLQSFFNEHVFKKEQRSYEEEGISFLNIGFFDNQGVLDVIENGRKSVMLICDDMCWLDSSTEAGFLKRIHQNAQQLNPKNLNEGTYFLFKPKVQEIRKKKILERAFTVKHFAGLVHYVVDGFLDKNKDQLRVDVVRVLNKSSLEMVSEMFPDPDAGGRQAGLKKSLGHKFRQSLKSLMKQLNNTTPQFIRTIKPNEQKAPGLMEAPKTFKQLRESGLLEVCEIRKRGYPIKKLHDSFYKEYLPIDKSAKDVKDLCDKLEKKKILTYAGMEKTNPNWQIGKSLVFLRVEQVQELDYLRTQALKEVIMAIQRFGRKTVFRMRVKEAMGFLKMINQGLKNKDPEKLVEGVNFFLTKGPTFRDLPVVHLAQQMVKELQKEIEVIQGLKESIESGNINQIKVSIDVAKKLGLGSHALVAEGESVVHNYENVKVVKEKLENALGSQDINLLREAIETAQEKDLGNSESCILASQMLSTLEEREELLSKLKHELSNWDEENPDLETLNEIVNALRANGCPEGNEFIVEATKKGDLVVERNKKQEQRVDALERQLKKNIRRRNVEKLKEIVKAAVAFKYNGPLVEQAMRLVKVVESRNDFLTDVSTATNVVREKSQLKDGISKEDLAPLEHALKRALEVDELDLGNEIQVTDGQKLLEKMHKQLEIQLLVSDVLNTPIEGNMELYTTTFAKVQELGLQTRDAGDLAEKIRRHQIVEARMEAVHSKELAERLKKDLRVPSDKERIKHLCDRVDAMHSRQFRKKALEAASSRENFVKNYYKQRSLADFVSREPKNYREKLKQLRNAYVGQPITRSMLELDEHREEKALRISEMISDYCDGLSSNQKGISESLLSNIVETGISDEILADEIYVQLTKHLTANGNSLSENKGWHVICLCATFFNCTPEFFPFLINFLENKVSSLGLQGNYAKYTLAQLSASEVVNCREVRFKPTPNELKAFALRPPVLLELEIVNKQIVNIPLPPDLSLSAAAKIIRRATSIPISLEKPEYSIYIKATTAPSKLSYKARLENFYRRYKPENLANVDEVLDYYKGNEEQLFRELVATPNYGPEPTARPVGPERRIKKSSSRKLRVGRGDDEGDDDDDIRGRTQSEIADDLLETGSEFSVGSKASVGSAISAVGSVIQRVFQRARGLSTIDLKDIDIPPPTMAWPLPWWTMIGDIVRSLYEQNKVPVLTYRRRILKTKGTPDENLYLQLRSDFISGVLTPPSQTETAYLSALICVISARKHKVKWKEIGFGDQNRLVQNRLVQCIPKPLRRSHKRNEEWLDMFLETAAERSLDFSETKDLKKLQKMFFDYCRKLPTYGMSFFFATVMRARTRGVVSRMFLTYFARARLDLDFEEDGQVKVGISQKEIAFFRNGEMIESYPLDDVVEASCNETAFIMKVKRTSKKTSTFMNPLDEDFEGDGDDADFQLGNIRATKSTRGLPMLKKMTMSVRTGMTTLRKNMGTIIGKRYQTIQLYTYQPKEMLDFVTTMKDVEPEH